MSTEKELKLALEGITAEQLQSLPEVLAHAVGTARQRQVNSIYFDTDTLSLLKRGIALRLRRDGRRWVQTAKTSGSACAGLHKRGEWETALDGPDLQLDRFQQPQLKKLFAKPELRAALVPVFRTEFERTSWDLHYPRNVHIEMALDLGWIQVGGDSEKISEIELELIRGKPEDLLQTARALAETVPVRLSNDSKAYRGYRLATDYLPSICAVKAGPLAMHKKTSAEQAFVAILRQGISQLQSKEPLLLTEPRDIECGQKMRAATQRMQSCLQVFQALIPKAVSLQASTGIRRVSDALSTPLEWDVFIEETLHPLGQTFPQHQGLEAMLLSARNQRETAYVDAATFIQSPVYTRFLLDLSLWIEQRAWRKALSRPRIRKLDGRARGFARSVLDRYHRKVIRQGQRFEKLDAIQRQQLRIRCKRLRHGAEFFADLFGNKRSSTYIRALSGVQEVLEVLNDSRVVAHLLEQLSAEKETPVADLVRGWMAANVRAHRGQFALVWNKFNSRGAFWD